MGLSNEQARNVPAASGARALAAVILAAGKGTRMKSDLPKVLHPVGGRPMVCAVIDACLAVNAGPIVVVVGHRQELVREALRDYGQAISYAVQQPQLGTGHAVQCAREVLGPSATSGDCLVLCGDGPLIRAATLRELHSRHVSTHSAATLATAIIEDPSGYGRIMRDSTGAFRGIVEHKDAGEAQRRIREVNPSYYCFRSDDLFTSLAGVKRQEASGEYYLTDTLPLLLSQGQRVEVLAAVPPEDVLSINTPEDLAKVDGIYLARGADARPVGTVRSGA